MFREFCIAFIISIDIYLAAAACCNSGIKIPLRSAFIIDLFSTVIMFVSVSLSGMISRFITSDACHKTGTVVLITLGSVNIAKSVLRNIVGRLSEKGSFSVKMGDLSLFVKLCLDDTAVDMDSSKVLSGGEAAFLAVAGSLDAAASGLSCGSDISAAVTSVFTFICGASALMLGSFTGRKISSLHHDFSWSGGLLLILFAVFSS